MGINYSVRRVRVCHPIRLSDASSAPNEMSIEMEAVPSDGVSIVAQIGRERGGLPPLAQPVEVHKIRLTPSPDSAGGSIALLPASVEGGTHFPTSIDVSIRLGPAQFEEILGLITGRMDVEAALIEFEDPSEILTLATLPNNIVTVTWASYSDNSEVQTVPVVGLMLSYRPSSENR